MEKFLTFLFGTLCSNCHKRGTLRRGHYSRAYNTLCNQADGESGEYCMHCHTIHFRTPDFKEWLAKQPEWIKSWDEVRKMDAEEKRMKLELEKKAKHTINLKRPDEETLEIYVDGESVGDFNHDEYGWTGMEAAEKVITKLAEKLGIEITEDDE